MAIAVQNALRAVVSVSTRSHAETEFGSFSGLRSVQAAPGVKLSRSSQRLARKELSVRGAATTAVAPKFKTLKPLFDRILVKVTEVEEKTAGGILLPSAAQSKPTGGEVVAIGNGRTIGDKQVPISIQTGSSVVYSKFAGTEVEFNGEDHLILKEDDIIGLLATNDDVKELKPLNDRVLIKVTESADQTAGGVLLTESAKEKPVIGDVVAVGPGALGENGERKALDLSPGNIVLYSKYAGSDFKGKDGSQYVVLRANDIMAVLS